MRMLPDCAIYCRAWQLLLGVGPNILITVSALFNNIILISPEAAQAWQTVISCWPTAQSFQPLAETLTNSLCSPPQVFPYRMADQTARLCVINCATELVFGLYQAKAAPKKLPSCHQPQPKHNMLQGNLFAPLEHVASAKNFNFLHSLTEWSLSRMHPRLI